MSFKVEELIEDEHHLVCLLIDEVESLTAARSAVVSGTEPSDAIRVVNALLTQIDRLKKYKNVLILTTSNVTGKIDLAFVDRADIKFYIGLPSPVAIYSIFLSCLEELNRVRVIQPKEPIERDPTNLSTATGHMDYSQRLWKLANKSVGLSGRTLRKLPFLAHARFIHTHGSVTLGCFLDVLSKAVEVQFSEKEDLSDLQLQF